MESSDKSKKVRLSSSNILTYRRDERGVIQWDCFQAPDSAKQTTGDFDEPDGDAASVFTTQQSVPTGQNDSCRRSVKSLNNFYPGTGNLYQFQDPTPLTGSVETNHPLLQGRGMTGDFPPCAATGSSASPLNDSEVKVCVNAERMSDATGCFPSHYSPLTPPATPKKSHRVLRQGEGQGPCQVQGLSCHKPQTPRDGSKFSFPDSVASAQKWSCPPSPRAINSPELAAEAAVSGQRKENVSLISPCPPGAGYTPKSPVVLFQFDSNVDETILKRIIKKFNDDVAKEADEIKPITLQDPPKSKQKKKQVRWSDNAIEANEQGEITAPDVACMEEQEEQSAESNHEGHTVPLLIDGSTTGPPLHNKEDLILRPGVGYSEEVSLQPGSCYDDYIETWHKQKSVGARGVDVSNVYTHQNSSDESDDGSPPQHPHLHGRKSPSIGEDGCFPSTTFVGPAAVSAAFNRTKNAHVTAMMLLSQQNFQNRLFQTAGFASKVHQEIHNQGKHHRQTSPASKTSPTYRDSQSHFPDRLNPLPASPSLRFSSTAIQSSVSDDSQVPFFQFPPPSPSPKSAFLRPTDSPSSLKSLSCFRFPPTSLSDRKISSPFRVPPSLPSHTEQLSFSHHESSPFTRHNRSSGNEDSRSYTSAHESSVIPPWNFPGHRDNQKSKFPRSTLPPKENPWRFPISQNPQQSSIEPRETTLLNTNSSPGEARRRLFCSTPGLSSRSESDVDDALTCTILNYLVKKNILTPEDSARLRQNARGSNQTFPDLGRTCSTPTKYDQRQYSGTNNHVASEQDMQAIEDERIRILRQRGHSVGEIEDTLLARSVDLLRSPCFQRSHSLPVPPSPKKGLVQGRDGCRKRRRGNIDIRVECEEVTQHKRQLAEDMTSLEQPRGSPSCFCAEVEDQILQMTREAYTNIRRHDDTPEAFERFENEVQQTNINITDALCILRTLKQLCSHGRTIEQIYPGSIVFRINCPSKSALLELWRWYQTGELLDLLQQGLVTDGVLLAFSAEEIRLNVTIENSDFQNCLEELEFAEGVDFSEPSQNKMVMEQNNENAPKPGHLTPKKSRRQNPEENYTPRDLRRSNDPQDTSSAASPVSQTPMSPIRIALQDWELTSPASRPIPNLPRYQPRVPRPLTSSSSKPMVDVNVVREQTSEFLVLREPYHSLSPSRKAFQELNFSSR